MRPQITTIGEKPTKASFRAINELAQSSIAVVRLRAGIHC